VKNPPKAKGMSKQIDNFNDILRTPAHPFTGPALWNMLRRSVSQDRGFNMTLNRIGRIVGKKTSSVDHWLNLSEQQHVSGFVCLLERLTEEERTRLIREICRTFPTLLDSRLTYAPQEVEALFVILRKTHGVTVVSGALASLRTFLITAFGHTFPQLDRRHRMPVGVDIHQPDWFVPIETVVYLRSPISRERLRQAVRSVWPEIRNSSAPLLVFNGIWSLFPEYQNEILSWARERHVIIADSTAPAFASVLRQRGIPIHVITVSQLREGSDRIQVICECARS
jgi:hypothetical protein